MHWDDTVSWYMGTYVIHVLAGAFSLHSGTMPLILCSFGPTMGFMMTIPWLPLPFGASCCHGSMRIPCGSSGWSWWFCKSGSSSAARHPLGWEIHELLPQIWGFPKIGNPTNGWFTNYLVNRLDDFGGPVFWETPIFAIILDTCMICNSLYQSLPWGRYNIPWRITSLLTAEWIVDFSSAGSGNSTIPGQVLNHRQLDIADLAKFPEGTWWGTLIFWKGHMDSTEKKMHLCWSEAMSANGL